MILSQVLSQHKKWFESLHVNLSIFQQHNHIIWVIFRDVFLVSSDSYSKTVDIWVTLLPWSPCLSSPAFYLYEFPSIVTWMFMLHDPLLNLCHSSWFFMAIVLIYSRISWFPKDPLISSFIPSVQLISQLDKKKFYDFCFLTSYTNRSYSDLAKYVV